jgi:cytosine/adenosine deaminase-related metal-dependent hydrolase
VSKARGRTLELNLFAEMSFFAAAHPDVPPENILQMATVNGARALGLRGRIGEIASDACADMIAIPFLGKMNEAYDAVVGYRGEIGASLIDGEWAIAPA